MRKITKEMIITREVDKTVTKRNGETKTTYKYSLNVDFWKNQKEPVSITLDEFHSMMNSREAMSKKNIMMSNFLALARKLLQSTDAGTGDLTLISQLGRRIDPIARDMATQVRYHVMHFLKTCKKCDLTLKCSSEDPEEPNKCPQCDTYTLKKHSHSVECWHYASMNHYDNGAFHRHYFIHDIEDYFMFYNTYAWDDLF